MTPAGERQRELAVYCGAILTARGLAVGNQSDMPADCWIEEPALWESARREPPTHVRIAVHPLAGAADLICAALCAVGLDAWVIPAWASFTGSAYVTVQLDAQHHFALPPFPFPTPAASPARVPHEAGAAPAERTAA